MNFFKKNLFRAVLISAILLFAGSLSPAKAADKGYISFSFDDGLQSTYDVAYPILKANNCSATAYITTDWIGVRNFMKWDQVRNLQNEGGWEIGNHTANHDYLWKKQFKTKYIVRDLTRSQQAFADNGIIKPVSFAPPYGKWNNRLMDVVRSMGFATSRRAWAAKDYSNNPSNFNRYALESMNLQRKVPFAKIKAEIDYAAESHRWLIFTIHNVKYGKLKKSDFSAEELQQVAEYVNALQNSGDVEVLPVEKAFLRF